MPAAASPWLRGRRARPRIALAARGSSRPGLHLASRPLSSPPWHARWGGLAAAGPPTGFATVELAPRHSWGGSLRLGLIRRRLHCARHRLRLSSAACTPPRAPARFRATCTRRAATAAPSASHARTHGRLACSHGAPSCSLLAPGALALAREAEPRGRTGAGPPTDPEGVSHFVRGSAKSAGSCGSQPPAGCRDKKLRHQTSFFTTRC